MGLVDEYTWHTAQICQLITGDRHRILNRIKHMGTYSRISGRPYSCC